jgi:hypothetical protein
MNINAGQFGPWAVVTGAPSAIGREFARLAMLHVDTAAE